MAEKRRETICVTTILEECLKGGVGGLISSGATPSHPSKHVCFKNGAVVRVHIYIQMFVQNYYYKIINKIRFQENTCIEG